jgi:hypothetical protein
MLSRRFLNRDIPCIDQLSKTELNPSFGSAAVARQRKNAGPSVRPVRIGVARQHHQEKLVLGLHCDVTHPLDQSKRHVRFWLWCPAGASGHSSDRLERSRLRARRALTSAARNTNMPPRVCSPVSWPFRRHFLTVAPHTRLPVSSATRSATSLVVSSCESRTMDRAYDGDSGESRC